MIRVKVFKQSNYPVSSPQIKHYLRIFLTGKGIVSEARVSVALVDRKKMLSLSGQYLQEKKQLHNVLSFPAREVRSDFLDPDKSLDLGEIIVCYPVAFEEAKSDNKTVEQKIKELIEHGALHLLGIHHR